MRLKTNMTETDGDISTLERPHFTEAPGSRSSKPRPAADRADIIVGRGSFIEPYPLFGFDNRRLTHRQIMRAIELLGTEVAPRVRSALDGK
jgi:hypothetical protein